MTRDLRGIPFPFHHLRESAIRRVSESHWKTTCTTERRGHGQKRRGIGERSARSRFAPMEFRKGVLKPKHYSGTPPLEAVRLLLSLCATEKDKSTCMAHMVVS